MQVQTKEFKAQIAQARDRIEESDAEYRRIKRKTIPIIKRIDDPLIDLEQRHKMKENTFNRPPSSLPFKTKKPDDLYDYETELRKYEQKLNDLGFPSPIKAISFESELYQPYRTNSYKTRILRSFPSAYSSKARAQTKLKLKNEKEMTSKLPRVASVHSQRKP